MPSHWFLFGLACAAALPAAYTLDPCLDTDTWWHMATGRWIVTHGTVPWVDPFSVMAGSRWYAYSWLYGIGAYEFFVAGSYGGIMAFRTVLVAGSTAAVLLLLIVRSGMSASTLLMALLAGGVLMMFAKERPWHFSIILTATTLHLMQMVREGAPTARAVGLVPLFAVWANLHIQFVFGWLILGLACVFPGNATRRNLIILTAACFIATSVNPYHFRLLIVIWDYATQTAALEFVQELMPPEPFAPSTLLTVALIVIGIINLARKQPRDWFLMMLLVISTIFAIRMRRDIWLPAVVSLATMPRSELPCRRLLTCCALVVLGTFIALRVINVYVNGPTTNYEAANRERYPVKACEFILKTQVEGAKSSYPIINDFNDGGYIIWAMHPSFLVTIDGRTNLYDDYYSRYIVVSEGRLVWRNAPPTGPTTHALLRKAEPTPDLYHKGQYWVVQYEDEFYTFYNQQSPGE